MLKKRTYVNGVYTPEKTFSFNGNDISIAANGQNDNFVSGGKDDGKRLRIKVYGKDIKVVSSYRNGFSIEADNSQEISNLLDLLRTLLATTCECVCINAETPRFDKDFFLNYSNNINEYHDLTIDNIISDINGCENEGELEMLMKSIKGFASYNKIAEAYNKKRNTLQNPPKKTLYKPRKKVAK